MGGDQRSWKNLIQISNGFYKHIRFIFGATWNKLFFVVYVRFKPRFNSFLQCSLGVIVEWRLFRPLVANKEYKHL